MQLDGGYKIMRKHKQTRDGHIWEAIRRYHSIHGSIIWGRVFDRLGSHIPGTMKVYVFERDKNVIY